MMKWNRIAEAMPTKIMASWKNRRTVRAKTSAIVAIEMFMRVSATKGPPRPFSPASCQSGVSGKLTMPGKRSVLMHFGPIALEFCPGGLGVETAPLAGKGGFGGTAGFWRRRGAPDEVEETLAGLCAVAFLGAMVAGQDNQNAVFGQSLAGQRHQTVPYITGKRW